MKFYTATPAKVLLFFFVLILQFSCSKDSDLLAEQIFIDPEVAIGEFVRNDTFRIITSNNATENTNSSEETIEISVSDESGTIINDSYEVTSNDGIELDVLANDTFFAFESIIVMPQPGCTRATGTPGKPAPEPISTIRRCLSAGASTVSPSTNWPARRLSANSSTAARSGSTVPVSLTRGFHLQMIS